MVNTEQFIGEYNVPMDGVPSAPITKQAYDIENPGKRTSDFSKTIKIPESKEANKAFEHYFEYNSELNTFNPNLKTDYLLIEDGATIIKGHCQLTKVTRTDGLRYYHIQARGAVADLFQSIGEALLTALDFSSLDHVWNGTNVTASWTPTLGTGYVYPMINYGPKRGQILWNVDEFKPALFLKEYIDAIFEAAGFTYSSAFFNSTRFKSIIIPQSSDVVKMSNATILDRQFLVDRSVDLAGINPVGLWNAPSSINTVVFDDDSTAPNYNTGATAYDTTNGQWTVSFNGRYQIKLYLDFDFDYTQSSIGTTYAFQDQIDNLYRAYLEVPILRTRSGTTTIVDVLTFDMTPEMDGETITSSYTSPNITGAQTSAEFDVFATDIIEIGVGSLVFEAYSGPGGISRRTIPFSGSAFDVNINAGSQLGAVITRTTLIPGDTMSMNDTIPPEVKQKELLGWIIKRFNLHMEYEESDNKKLIVEPREDFLQDDTEDIDHLVDESKEITITPMGALESSEFLFMDQEDDDEINQMYQTGNPYTYGYWRELVDTDFKTTKKEISNGFSPAPLWNNGQSDRILASMAFPRDLGGFSEETSKPKLLYWGGLLSTNNVWYLNGVGGARSTYPYAGHLDDPYDPNFDLSWGPPKKLYYDLSAGGRADLVYTNSNIYNIYWKKNIEEITNKNSRTMELYLNISPAKFAALSFRKQYYIRGGKWRLLEVTDYDPMKHETTMCKFIKVEPGTQVTGAQTTIYGGDGTLDNGEDAPVYGKVVTGDGGSGLPINNLIYGRGIQAPDQAIVNADDVKAGRGTPQQIVSGSDEAQIWAREGAAINSKREEIYLPGTTFIGGVNTERVMEVTLDATRVDNLNSSPYFLLHDPASDEHWVLKRGYASISVSTPFTGGGNPVIRTRTTGTTIATFPAGFVNSGASTKALLTIAAESFDQGEGWEIYNSAEASSGTGSTIKLILIYQLQKV